MLKRCLNGVSRRPLENFVAFLELSKEFAMTSRGSRRFQRALRGVSMGLGALRAL